MKGLNLMVTGGDTKQHYDSPGKATSTRKFNYNDSPFSIQKWSLPNSDVVKLYNEGPHRLLHLLIYTSDIISSAKEATFYHIKTTD